MTRILFWTCRVEEIDYSHWKKCRANEPFIAAFWHYSVYHIIHRSRGTDWVAMVSASSDGEYISQLLMKMGYKTVRGSKGKEKKGLMALKGMMTWVKKGKNAAIVADGSQGPARIAQPGAILIASRTGAPILPVVCAGDRYWAINSWDKSIIPKPFSRIIIKFGEPIIVPAKISVEEVENYRIRMEGCLNELYREVWSHFNKTGHV